MLASLCVLNVFTIRSNIRPKKEDPKSLLHNDQLMMWEEQRSLTLNSGNTSHKGRSTLALSLQL